MSPAPAAGMKWIFMREKVAPAPLYFWDFGRRIARDARPRDDVRNLHLVTSTLMRRHGRHIRREKSLLDGEVAPEKLRMNWAKGHRRAQSFTGPVSPRIRKLVSLPSVCGPIQRLGSEALSSKLNSAARPRPCHVKSTIASRFGEQMQLFQTLSSRQRQWLSATAESALKRREKLKIHARRKMAGGREITVCFIIKNILNFIMLK
ncbi:hypothetical protein EVAR_63286_1 [Eumeta japonica]|uniref:Uncharacterized protein n=1 Tax=Eumeta variegata TaxID=151549 RepID=A0A4C1ZXV7_EUMVA|nr:hypothetical protein EVAR_63286_1 [Eumeta japonica]